MAKKSSRRDSPPDVATPSPTAPASEDEQGAGSMDSAAGQAIYSTRWYWVSLFLSAFSFGLSLTYYDSTIPGLFVGLFWLVIAVSGGFFAYTTVGLIQRYRVLQRMKQRSTHVASRSRIALKQARTQDGPLGPNATQSAGRGFTGFFGFFYRLVLRIVYFFEATFVWAIILSYDVVYGVLYAGWWVANLARRVAWKTTHLALRMTWKVVRIPTTFPGLKGVWADNWRPKILASWNSRIARRRKKWTTSVARKKRMVAAKGGDPEAWHKDQIERHWFPLPRPHLAKVELKKRLEHAAKTKNRRMRQGLTGRTPQEREQRRREKAERKSLRKGLSPAPGKTPDEDSSNAPVRKGEADQG